MRLFNSNSRNRIIITLTIFVFAFACKKEVKTSNLVSTDALNTANPANTYRLVWSDEFNGTSIDTTNWVFDLGGGGWGNNEQEYYTASNATVKNGNLIITAKQQTIYAGYNYTSARMKTQGKRQFTYGKIAARIKLPVGIGLWPAFWMLGANFNSVGWPYCGETDIMEHINTDSLIYGTIHWYYNGNASYGSNMACTPSAYHIYSVQWDSTGIRWYVDNALYVTANTTNNINGTQAFQSPFFILLNLAVGGNWPGQTIDNTKFPAKMYVDYVRVYQKN